MINSIRVRIRKICNKHYKKSFLKNKNVVLGENLILHGRIYSLGTGLIEIGDNVEINSDFSVNPTGGGYGTSINSFEGAIVKIGNNVGISHTAISAMKSVEIGDNVLIGSNCMISDTDFHPLDAEIRVEDSNNREATKTAPIKIEKNVFVGARSIILKGVTIGEGAVVGAGSVVTKDIPAGEIWAGNPAKFIKKV